MRFELRRTVRTFLHDHSGEAVAAERHVRWQGGRTGLPCAVAELALLKKNDPGKVTCAALVRRLTAVPNEWRDTLFVRKGKNGKDRMLPVGERAAAWLDRFLAESRPLFHHLPQETARFLTGYGERFSPEYIGNWIKKLLQRCGIALISTQMILGSL